jgi:hypothetical protein
MVHERSRTRSAPVCPNRRDPGADVVMKGPLPDPTGRSDDRFFVCEAATTACEIGGRAETGRELAPTGCRHAPAESPASCGRPAPAIRVSSPWPAV